MAVEPFPLLRVSGVTMGARSNTRRMNRLRQEFFERGKRLDADPATRPESVCWICERRIDYDAEPGTTEESHELDHMIPVSIDPGLQEDPTNFRHAHRRCNRERSNRSPVGDLGDRVEAWW